MSWLDDLLGADSAAFVEAQPSAAAVAADNPVIAGDRPARTAQDDWLLVDRSPIVVDDEDGYF